MSDKPVLDALRKMEDDVSDIGSWGRVLCDLGTVEIDVDKVGVRVIGRAIVQLGDRLDAQWKAAFNAAGGKA